MNEVRWGIIGCGNVTEVKSGPAFYKATGSRLVAVMRRDAAKAADYARRHGIARSYADARDLIDDREVDAVYVAAPPGSHEIYAMQVLASGKPCYVEKPMSRNAPEARRMVEAFQKARLPLFVAYYRRELPRFLKAKELIDAGTLGRISRASYWYSDSQMAKRTEPVAWRLNAKESGGGLFLDLGSHVLDMLDFWLGPLTPTQLSAENKRGAYDVEDRVSINFTTPNRVIGDASWDFASAAQDEFLIEGDQAEFRMSCFGTEPVRLKFKDGRKETFDLPNPPHVAQPLIQTIVDELRGIGKCASTGTSALRTQELIDRTLDSYYGGREDNFWSRPWPGAMKR